MFSDSMIRCKLFARHTLVLSVHFVLRILSLIFSCGTVIGSGVVAFTSDHHGLFSLSTLRQPES